MCFFSIGQTFSVGMDYAKHIVTLDEVRMVNRVSSSKDTQKMFCLLKKIPDMFFKKGKQYIFISKIYIKYGHLVYQNKLL